ncbi:hypothetical protein DRQ33_00465 [bacterium]|nr:MAG: hypothetical protein DRQ33_00465 [bacterium]
MRTKGTLGFLKDFVSSGKVGPEIPLSDFSADEIEEGKGLAILAYIPILCFIPFIQGKKTNRFAYEHGKQGVLLFLFEVVALLGALFWKAALFLASVAALVGIIYVLQGKNWKLPVIGDLGDKLEMTEQEQE